MKKFDTILCNPPYNGGDNETPIYQLFVEKFSDSQNSIWIIPSSWTGNPNWSVGKTIRTAFYKMGTVSVYKNRDGTFENARVRTSSTVCSQNSKDKWEWIDSETGKVILKPREEMIKNKILFSFDQAEIDFIERMREYSEGKMSWFNNSNPTNWKIGVFHINRDKSKNQLGGIRLMDPKEFDAKHAHKYLKLWEGGSEKEANEMMVKIESFWNSTLIQYLLGKVWHTYTIQRSTFEWIPAPDYSKVWTDEELYEKYSVTPEEKEWIIK